MKKIFAFMLLTMSLFAVSTVHAQYDNAKSQIECENGKVVVSGTFENASEDSKTYSVILAQYDDKGKLAKIPVYQSAISMKSGENTFSYECDIDGKEMKVKLFVLDNDAKNIIQTIDKTIKSLRILAIGNSFSVDGMQWLYQIAKEGGIDNIVLGNMYIGGCSLAMHRSNAEADKEAYTYYKNITGTWTNTAKQALDTAITDEPWDIISIQQQSAQSGLADTYNADLDYLIKYINGLKINEDAQLIWHQTWAYPSVYTPVHKEFVTHDCNQTTMYNSIVNAVKTKIATNDAFAYYIPSGTAVQNARGAGFTDYELTRDTCHLSYNLGRYIAGLTWFHKITGLPIDDITFVPTKVDVPKSYLPIIKECVKNAVLYPDKVTSTQETIKRKSYDLSNYTELEWTPITNAYLDSQKSSEAITDDSNAPKYITTKIFTRDELPNGTLLVIDEGYMYRPEGWVTLDSKNEVRPDNVALNIVEVTDEWWGDYNYRAFNISTIGAKDISNRVDEVAGYFRIYLPK